MELDLYYETELEAWVYAQYRRFGICSPPDLDIDMIAESFDTEIKYYEGNTFCSIEDKLILIDKRLHVTEQRSGFFHELCHILRHYGDQRTMPRSFFKWQEDQADSFSHYAMMPFYMVLNLELPETKQQIIGLLTHEFVVDEPFAQMRLEQIQRRIISGHMFKVCKPDPAPKVWTTEMRRLFEQFYSQTASSKQDNL